MNAKHLDFEINAYEASASVDRSHELRVHPNHRLWLIADIDQAAKLPISLVFDSIKWMPKMTSSQRVFNSCKEVLGLYEVGLLEHFLEQIL